MIGTILLLTSLLAQEPAPPARSEEEVTRREYAAFHAELMEVRRKVAQRLKESTDIDERRRIENEAFEAEQKRLASKAELLKKVRAIENQRKPKAPRDGGQG